MPKEIDPTDPDGEFMPTILNSAVYLISTTSTCVSFACNYRGEPFMVGLKKHKKLYNSIFYGWLLMFTCATGLFEPINELMELAPFPEDHPELCLSLMGLMLFDLLGSLLYCRTLKWYFALKGHVFQRAT